MGQAKPNASIEARLARRIAAYRFRRNRIQKIINIMAAFRLVFFLGIVVGVALAVGKDFRLEGGALALFSSGVFLYLMVRQDRCYRFANRCEIAEKLLADDLARVQFQFNDIQYEHPITFEDHHPFAHDLDMSAGSSILKLLDNSFHGKTKAILKRWIDHIDQPEDIRMRQEAVTDLAKRKRIRLKLGVAAHTDSVRELDSKDLNAWLSHSVPWTLKPPAYIFGRLLSLFTTSSVIIHFGFNSNWPWLPQVFFQLAVFWVFDMVHRGFTFSFMQRAKAISATCTIIGLFENQKVEAPLLVKLRDGLLTDGKTAGPHLKKLLGLNEMLEYRSNGFAHFFLNGLFLWDQYYLRKLSIWRESYGKSLPGWVDSIFEFEALCALANYRELFPTRPFPKLVEGQEIHLEASNMAHPTIHRDKRIGNDYLMDHNGRLHLITGSNMSGKSTFLRTIGLNLVLARMGAPVCAKALTCSLPRLWTSIKIQDSLADDTSYFYAEVKRIKLILDEVKKPGPPVFYLLDEILKGTNSRERLIASKAMAAYLLENASSGLITTHDLEMLHLSREKPDVIVNYHFQEQVEGDEMFFDYKLKPGELTSTNALRVMRFAGVPLDL